MIIITGASKGIGKYIFDRYQEAGLDVVGTYNSTLVDTDKEQSMSKVDISNFQEVSSWIEGLDLESKDVTLINCAGINYNAFGHKADIEKWEKVIQVNLIGSFNVIRCLLPHMRNQSYGRIINFSSVTAQLATPGISAYAASKAGMWGMAKSLATENGAKGITINNINLGYSELGMIKEVPEKFVEIIKAKIPSKEFCSPEDIFNTVEYLVQTKYVNGTSIDLNGGIF